MNKLFFFVIALLSINTLNAQLGTDHCARPTTNIVDTTVVISGVGPGCTNGECPWTRMSFNTSPRKWVQRIDSVGRDIIMVVDFASEYGIKYQSSSVRVYNGYCRIYYKQQEMVFGSGSIQGITLAEGGYLVLLESPLNNYYLPSKIVFLPYNTNEKVVEYEIRPNQTKKFWNILNKYNIGNADWRFLML